MTIRASLRASLSTVFLSTLLSGCSLSGQSENTTARCAAASCEPVQPGPIDPNGSHHQYVIDSVWFGGGLAEDSTVAVELNCSQTERPDNALGRALVTVYEWLDTDLQAIVDETIDDGRSLHLIDLQATSLDNSSEVGVQVFVGVDPDADPSDNFSGGETFEVDRDAPTQPMAGRIEAGRLVADFGDVPLQVALPGIADPYVLELKATHIDAVVTPYGGLAGNIGGVLRIEEFESGFMTVAHAAVARIVASDCVDQVCVPESRGEALVGLMDLDGDVEVSLEELLENSLVRALTDPDMDMYSDGELTIDCDGERDSLSLSVGFTARPAQFQP